MCSGCLGFEKFIVCNNTLLLVYRFWLRLFLEQKYKQSANGISRLMFQNVVDNNMKLINSFLSQRKKKIVVVNEFIIFYQRNTNKINKQLTIKN